MHDLTNSTRTWLAEDLIDVVIDQNARLVGEQAVIRLLGAIAASARLRIAKEALANSRQVREAVESFFAAA